jgi:hypothetical protein
MRMIVYSPAAVVAPLSSNSTLGEESALERGHAAARRLWNDLELAPKTERTAGDPCCELPRGAGQRNKLLMSLSRGLFMLGRGHPGIPRQMN